MGRRFFIGLGSGQYKYLSPEEQLHQVPEDLRAVTEIFTAYDYRAVLPGLGQYDGAEQIRQKLRHWSTDVRLDSDDVVVVYFAGHGIASDRDRHYLMCWDSHDDDPATTALATEDLVRILCRGELRHLLLILDTCAAGAGSAEAATVALRAIAYRNEGPSASTGLWFLAGARRKDLAEDGIFVPALRDAVKITTGRTGQRQPYLDLTELVKAINECFDKEGRGQRAELAGGLVTGLAPFFPNAAFRDDLPPIGTDLEEQRRVAEYDLTDHFGPRSRGVEFESEQGLYFSGRTRVLTELVGWLTDERGDGKGRVVTGSPGCGKSAVLGRIVALSDADYRSRFDFSDIDPVTVVPEGCVSAAVHARHKRLEEIVDRIAKALGLQVDGTAALLQELTRRARLGTPIVIVVDAVDEAGSDTAADAGGHGEPRRITRELLRPMAEIQGVRLLVGTRHELVSPLGPTFACLDLDEPGYRADESDIAGYVARVLLAAEESDVHTPYRDRRDLAVTVARAVADRAVGNFLYARTTARTLRSDRAAVDVSRTGWVEDLPSEVGEAFDDYLSRFGPDEARVRRMLLPLAFSEGKGLPRGRVWTTLSSLLSGVDCSEEDISWLLDVAEAYIAEVIDDDQRSVYRLYHKALAEHLRRTAGRPAVEIQRSIVEALVAIVPKTAGGGPDWFAAAPYVSRHLATHAGAGGALAELVRDPGFLLGAEPLGLLRVLTSLDSASARRVRTAYEQVAHRLTADRPLGSRAADLQLSARRCEADELADRIDELKVTLPWTACWAWWSASGAHRLLTGHTKSVDCVAIGSLDGRPIAVTGGPDKTARIWDLSTQRQIGAPLQVGVAVTAVAIGELGDYTVVLTGGADGTVRVWDLSAGQEYGAALSGHSGQIKAMVIGELSGKPVVLTASQDGTARLWDLLRRTQLGSNLTGHQRTVNDAALGELDGRPVAATGGEDKTVQVWDLSDLLSGGDARLDGSPLIGPAEAVTAVSLAILAGRTVALVGDRSGMLSLWDLALRRQLGEQVVAHRYFQYSGVGSIAVGELDGRAIALTTGIHEARLWDLPSLRQISQPLRGHVSYINSAALAARGMAPVAVTVSDDRTARIWDLLAEQPPEGHAGRVLAMDVYTHYGRSLAITGGEDGIATLWDLRDRNMIGAPMTGHRGEVLAVALGSVNGQLLAATGGMDATVRLWNPLRGEALTRPLTGHTNVVHCVALGTLGGEPIVVSGGEDGTVGIWRVPSGELRMPPLTGHIGGIRHMALREVSDGIEIAVCTSLKHAYLWRVKAGTNSPPRTPLVRFDIEELATTAHGVGVAFHDGRAIVLCAREGNRIYAHDIETRAVVGKPLSGHTGSVIAGRIFETGAATLVSSIAYDGTARVWDLTSGEQLGLPMEGMTHLFRPKDHARPAPVLGNVNGSHVVIIAFSREVRVWDLSTTSPVGEPLCGLNRSLVSADIIESPAGGRAVVTGSLDGAVRMHDLGDGRQVAPHITSGNTYELSDVATAQVEDEAIILISTWQAADVWSTPPRRRLGKRSAIASRACLCIVDGRAVAISAARDHSLHVWDVRSQMPQCSPMTGHTDQVTALRPGIVNGSELVASASYDGTVRVWNVRTGQPCMEPITNHELGAYSVDFADIGQDIVVSGAGDGRVHFSSLAGAALDIELEPFPSAVRAIRAGQVNGTPVLIAADAYGVTRVWDMHSADWLAELDIGSGVTDVDVGGDRVCVATQMGVVVLGINIEAPTGTLVVGA